MAEYMNAYSAQKKSNSNIMKHLNCKDVQLMRKLMRKIMGSINLQCTKGQYNLTYSFTDEEAEVIDDCIPILESLHYCVAPKYVSQRPGYDNRIYISWEDLT